jgi:hypothetical protein
VTLRLGWYGHGDWELAISSWTSEAWCQGYAESET